MGKYLGNFSPYFYAILRIVSGFMFAMYGSQKLLGWPGEGQTVELASMTGIAGIIELIGGVLIMIGFLTSWAAFIASGEMAVAFFMIHYPQGWNPLENQGVLAVLFCFVFLYMAVRGSGIWSIDTAINRNSRHDMDRKNRY